MQWLKRSNKRNDKWKWSYERKVSFEEGRALADKYGIPFIETSAKTCQSIEEMLQTLVCEIGSSTQDNDNPEENKKECIVQ